MDHSISTSKNLGGTRHRAFCSCGWISLAQPTEAAAEREGDDHVTYMIIVVEG